MGWVPTMVIGNAVKSIWQPAHALEAKLTARATKTETRFMLAHL
jgi:hypothetical protein